MPVATILSKANLILLGRLALFLGTIAILGWFSLIDIGRRLFVDPITQSAVLASHALINLFGGDAVREGTVLIGPQMSLDVKDACNGVVAMVLYVAAVVAHEARLGSKLIGLVLGLAAIWIVNLLRIVTLYAVAAIAPERLEFFHIYFWQTLIIIVVVAFWYIWASWTMRPAVPHAAPASR
jgi:exosortase/archaeosortase family protein